MRQIESSLRKLLLCPLVILVLALACSAQETSTPQKPGESQQGADPNAQPPQGATPDQNADATPPSPADPVNANIQPAGRAIPWVGTASPLRWGGFSITGFTLAQIRDDFQPIGDVPSDNLNLTIVRTGIAFDKWWHKQHLVFEYDPQLAVLNGHIASNAGLDNSLSLGTVFAISPRFSIIVTNVLTQMHSRSLYPADFLAADQTAGNVVQGAFLQNNGSYLMDQTTAAFNYRYSERLLVTFSPTYQYVTETDKLSQGNYIADGQTAGGSAALTYSLTPRQSIGPFYSVQFLAANNVPGAANSYFHTLALFYSYQVSKNWWLRTQVGSVIAVHGAGIPDQTSVAADVALVRKFAHSFIAVDYGRGKVDQNFITPAIGERGDLGYTLNATRRITWTNGGGYYREIGADPRTKGNYASTKMTYALPHNFGMFATYTHTFQNSSTPQLLSGTRNSYFGGLSWAPPQLMPR